MGQQHTLPQKTAPPKPGDPILFNKLQSLDNIINYRTALLIQEENLLHKKTTPVCPTGFPDELCKACPALPHTTQLSQTHTSRTTQKNTFPAGRNWEGRAIPLGEGWISRNLQLLC